jgi:ribosomal protein S18 acetylase RimI-like enzyme
MIKYFKFRLKKLRQFGKLEKMTARPGKRVDMFQTRLLGKDDLRFFKHLMTGSVYDKCQEEGCLTLGALTPKDQDGHRVPVGLLAAEMSGASLNIFWLYIDTDHRRQSAGEMLLETLLDSVYWVEEIFSVSAVFPDNGNAEDVKAFFESAGFFFEENEAAIYTFKVNQLDGFAALNSVRSSVDKAETMVNKIVMPLGNSPKHLLGQLNADLAKADISAVPLPIDKDDYDEGSILCVQNNTAKGVLLLRRNEDGLEIPFVYVSPGTANSIPVMFAVTAEFLIKQFDGETMVSVSVVNKQSAALAEKLLDGADKMRICRVSADLPEIEPDILMTGG